MPAATTHVEFAKDVLRTLPQNIHDQITNYPMYYLGSQGPDMLFFSSASIPGLTLKQWGNKMHDEHVRDVIRFFEGRCMEDNDLRSYFYGYLCHYALDSTVHPLVFSSARKAHAETGINEGEAHVTIEAEYDVWILHQRGRDIRSYDVHSYMKPDPLSGLKLAVLYHDMLEEIFHQDIPLARLRRAVYDCPFYTRVLKPGSQFKFNLIYKIESIAKIPHSFSGMILDQKEKASALNLDRKEYAMIGRDETSTKSFPMLYGEACEFARRILAERTDEDFRWNFSGQPDPFFR